MPDPDWLPGLIEFEGEWQVYIDLVYDRFLNDLIRSKASYEGLRVAVRRDPESQGKGYGFWHCVSTGRDEDERVPDLDRCARIAWIRPIIDNCDDEQVDVWTNSRRGDQRVLLWFNEEFLVVLSQRSGYYLLTTAYPTTRAHSQEKLRKERDACKNG